MIKEMILTEYISEKKANENRSCGPFPIYDLTSNEAIVVTIEIRNDYRPEKIKEALSKIFEKAMQCW